MRILKYKISENTVGYLYAPPVQSCLQVGKWWWWWGAGGARQAAGAGDICDPAQQRWMPDTCFFLKGYWHRFCLVGFMPTLGASNARAFQKKNAASELVHCTQG